MNKMSNGGARWGGWADGLLLVLVQLLAWGYVVQILLRPEGGWAFYFSLTSLIILLLALVRARGWYRVISVTFLLAGLAILWQSPLPFRDVWHFFGSTTNILALLFFAPFFSIPITLGAYHRSALLIVRGRVRKPHSTYFVLTSFTYLLATLMNVAAIVAAYTTLHHLSRSFPKAVADKINHAAYCRGHTLALIWSPVGASLGVALARVPADPGTVIALGLGFSVVMVMLDTWMIKRWARHHAAVLPPMPVAASSNHISTVHWRRMGVFCGVIGIFVLGVIGLHEVFSFAVIDAVILLILFLSVFWAILLKKPKRLWQEVRVKSTSDVLGLLPQVMLFISVGFFTQVLTASGSLSPLVQMVTHWSASYGWLFILVIILVAGAGSQLGLYPSLIVMLLADLVPYEAMNLRPEWFVFAITAGAVGCVPASPLTINVNLVASLMKKDPIQVSRSNLAFAATTLSAVCLLTILLLRVFPA